MWSAPEITEREEWRPPPPAVSVGGDPADEHAIDDLASQAEQASRWRALGLALAIPTLGVWFVAAGNLIAEVRLDAFMRNSDRVVGVVEESDSTGGEDLTVAYTYHESEKVEVFDVYGADKYEVGEPVVIAVSRADASEAHLAWDDSDFLPLPFAILEESVGFAMFFGSLAAAGIAIGILRMHLRSRRSIDSDGPRGEPVDGDDGAW